MADATYTGGYKDNKPFGGIPLDPAASAPLGVRPLALYCSIGQSGHPPAPVPKLLCLYLVAGPGQFCFSNGNRQDGNYVPAAATGDEEEAGPADPQWVGGAVASESTESYVL